MMSGRGYKLVCKICDVPLQEGDNVESKPSQYQNWECDKCDFKSTHKPKQRVPVSVERTLPKCPKCDAPMYCIGRKFYHADCYEDAHRYSSVTITTTTTITPPRGIKNERW